MKIRTQQITYIALFLALCVIVPIIFHAFGGGAMFLPMFLPIVLSAFLIQFPYAIIVGLLGPWISGLATGMPPLFPTALIMSIEGIVAAGVVSWLYHKHRISPWISLVIGIFAERVAYFITIYSFGPLLGLPPKMLSTAAIIYTLPGVLLQLFLIPVLLKTIWKIKLGSAK